MFAAYIAGTAAMVGMDFGAKFLGSLASALEVSPNCYNTWKYFSLDLCVEGEPGRRQVLYAPVCLVFILHW